MPNVLALRGFNHDGIAHRAGERITVGERTAHELARRGLVQIASAARPRAAAGTPSSALPAAPASVQTPAPASKLGARKKKGGGSSS